MNTNLQEAYIIHSKAYKETSMLVTFFCRSDGKVTVVAKGSKRPKSKFSGNLEPFQKTQIDFVGKSTLKTLITCDAVGPFNEFCTRVNLYSAFYINELINTMVKSNEDPEGLFDLYEDCMQKLYSSTETEIILRSFELDLLRLLGYEINFSSDYISGGDIDSDSSYSYKAQMGFTKSNGGYKGEDLIEIKKRNFNRNNLLIAKNITKQTLEFYFEELNVNSRSFFK